MSRDLTDSSSGFGSEPSPVIPTESVPNIVPRQGAPRKKEDATRNGAGDGVSENAKALPGKQNPEVPPPFPPPVKESEKSSVPTIVPPPQAPPPFLPSQGVVPTPPISSSSARPISSQQSEGTKSISAPSPSPSRDRTQPNIGPTLDLKRNSSGPKNEARAKSVNATRSSRATSQIALETSGLPVFVRGERSDFSNDEEGKTDTTGQKWNWKQWKSYLKERVGMKETPSWLVSLVVHLAIILLLAIVPLADEISNAITILSGTAIDAGDGELASIDISETSDSMETNDLSLGEEIKLDSIADQFQPPPLPNLGGEIAIENAIRSGLKGRSGVLKDALLKAYGGTAGTQDAVAAGLAWLATQQRSDGSWSLVGPYRGGATSENKPAATAMALLAFLGAGNTHLEGEYKHQVKSGIRYLIKLQDENGFFAATSVGNPRTYAQAQCTIAICELYGMTGDSELEPIAIKAIKYAQIAQADNGGWRYLPKEPGDMSVTGWYVMALISARMGGLIVDSQVVENVHRFLDLVQRSGRGLKASNEGEGYAYQPNSVSTNAMTAEGMLCRLYLGWSAQDPRIELGAETLTRNLISADPQRRSFYYWYYATTTLHHIGGSHWKKWNDEMKEVLPAMQEKTGPNRGSWSAADDPHESGGGRLYATCFSIYCLESYYRHLPLNKLAHE